jgi:hypothetical protein
MVSMIPASDDERIAGLCRCRLALDRQMVIDTAAGGQMVRTSELKPAGWACQDIVLFREDRRGVGLAPA